MDTNQKPYATEHIGHVLLPKMDSFIFRNNQYLILDQFT